MSKIRPVDWFDQVPRHNLVLGLVPVGFPLSTPSLCLAQGYGGQDPGDLDIPNPFGQFPGGDDKLPRRGTRAKTACRKKLQPATKGTAKNR